MLFGAVRQVNEGAHRLGRASKVYSGLGADIVYGIITLTGPCFRRTKGASLRHRP